MTREEHLDACAQARRAYRDNPTPGNRRRMAMVHCRNLKAAFCQGRATA